MKGKPERALTSLGRLRRLPITSPTLREELNEIIANYEHELTLGKTSWLECIAKAGSQRKRLFTGCAVMALSQLSGINFIFYYGTQFFKNSGIKNPFLIGLTTNLVNVFSTIPGLILVEKWGRRPLLLFGAIGMCLCQFVISIVGVTASSQVANQVLIAFVCFYIFFFACSWGPVGWVVVVSFSSRPTIPNIIADNDYTGRDLPSPSARQICSLFHRKQLALQLGDRLRDSIHG